MGWLVGTRLVRNAGSTGNGSDGNGAVALRPGAERLGTVRHTRPNSISPLRPSSLTRQLSEDGAGMSLGGNGYFVKRDGHVVR